MYTAGPGHFYADQLSSPFILITVFPSMRTPPAMEVGNGEKMEGGWWW